MGKSAHVPCCRVPGRKFIVSRAPVVRIGDYTVFVLVKLCLAIGMHTHTQKNTQYFVHIFYLFYPFVLSLSLLFVSSYLGSRPSFPRLSVFFHYALCFLLSRCLSEQHLSSQAMASRATNNRDLLHSHICPTRPNRMNGLSTNSEPPKVETLLTWILRH